MTCSVFISHLCPTEHDSGLILYEVGMKIVDSSLHFISYIVWLVADLLGKHWLSIRLVIVELS